MQQGKERASRREMWRREYADTGTRGREREGEKEGESKSKSKRGLENPEPSALGESRARFKLPL
jgi:hypothetical protein